MRRLAFLGVLLTSVAAAPQVVRAGCAEGVEHIDITITGGDDLAMLVPAILEHLRVEMDRRSLAVCVAGEPNTPPLARLVVDQRDSASLQVEIAVIVGLASPLRRTVDLTSVPANARALTIGIAATEVLVANWAAVSEESAAPPAQVEKAPVSEPVAALAATAPTPEPVTAVGRTRLAVGLVTQVFGGSHGHGGPELRLQLPLAARIALQLRGAYLVARDVKAPGGTGESTAGALGIGLGLAVTPETRRAGLMVTASTEAIRVWASGDANPGTTARSGSANAWVADAGGLAWLRLGERVRVVLELNAGLVLRPVAMTDGELRVSALSGWAVRSLLGLVVNL